MSDQIVFTRNKPRRNLVRWQDGSLDCPNSVRVYRESPESVMLQLRRTKEYIGISLTLDEARQTAALLVREADKG